MAELNYGFQLSRAIRVMPNLQVVLKSDQQAESFRKTRSPDALVLGARLSIDLASL